MKYLSNYVPLKTLDQMYKMFVRPHLDYADVIYHIPHSKNLFDSSITLHPLMEKVERVQYHAALAITGCWQGSNQNKLYEELGWESLSDRRWSRRLIQLYKISNHLTPDYLTNSLPSLRFGSSRNGNAKTYQELMCNTARYSNSFFPDTIKSWNNIGGEFTMTNSIAIFKKSINELIRPKPKTVYNIHDPIGLKYIFQLRVGLSPLKFHKKNHNFLDTPDDICDCGVSSENVSHFLFYCPMHALPRLELRNTVSNILRLNNLIHLIGNTELYLYGHDFLDAAENKTVIQSTVKYIKDSNRFS